VLPTGIEAGRKKTPFRKMLNALKKLNASKLAPKVREWRP
jgi:hypothetical protein